MRYLRWKPALSFNETVDFTASWYRQYYQEGSIHNLTREQIERYMMLAAEQGIAWTNRSAVKLTA